MNQEKDTDLTKIEENVYKLDSLGHPSVKYLYQHRLDQKLNESYDVPTESLYNHIIKCLKEAAAEALGNKSKG